MIAIVGGGFTGAAVAANLARNAASDGADIVVFEPRVRLGAGLAYDTDNPAHRINVPAARMSLIPDDPDDFLNWMVTRGEPRDDPEALAVDGNLYPRRAVFGRYVGEFIAPFLKSGKVEHRRERVEHIERRGSRWRLSSSAGTELLADIVVIATTHPAPCAPRHLDQVLHGHPRYVPDSTVAGALACIRADDHVLVVGNGLTAADVIASLGLADHRGPIVALSRRGLRSRGHAAVPQEPFGDFTGEPARTALELLKRVRRALLDAADIGTSWHGVFDALRSQGGEIWRALPVTERRRLVRHLRPFWDVHRFRVAPQIDGAILHGLEQGRLRILGASIEEVERRGQVIAVDIRHRHTGHRERLLFDACVVTTGPAHTGILSSQGWLADLASQGWLRSDDVGLGLACDEVSCAIGANGMAERSLIVAGPLARGTFGELMGLPQVNDHAIFVANEVADMLVKSRRDSRRVATVARMQQRQTTKARDVASR
ncbi:FAD/NAD(P)-binding protein (plasmid) [Ensifer adhaerens]|uniref:FAD/NAD(P)-binding protein n=1 Tax=Ensifer adhaerens TaxID=106592 RepID=UPI0023A94E38|nr:FAD/NAD(P)-binding protein [Ensifer adhaerens]WDZ81119.1 FAD/NAD(P)-binding protein [Ensifer adhaerens]